jgi:hypothetical protein
MAALVRAVSLRPLLLLVCIAGALAFAGDIHRLRSIGRGVRLPCTVQPLESLESLGDMSAAGIPAMFTSEPVKAVLFDLDGTLLDTETLSSKATEMVLERFGVTSGVEWDLKKRILGLR